MIRKNGFPELLKPVNFIVAEFILVPAPAHKKEVKTYVYYDAPLKIWLPGFFASSKKHWPMASLTWEIQKHQ